MKKKSLAIVAGVLFVQIITALTDLALRAAGVYPGDRQQLDGASSLPATSYRLVIGVQTGAMDFYPVGWLNAASARLTTLVGFLTFPVGEGSIQTPGSAFTRA